MKKRLLCMLLALVMVCTLLPVTAFADYVIGTIMINYVEINGIDMPVVGELPDREVELPAGAAYTVAAPENFANSFIDGIAWYDVTTDEYMAEGEVFVSGHEYYPVIGLKAPASHKFANINSITGKTNLCDDIDVAGFYNADETQYICVYLGTMNDEWSAQPLHRNTITTQNCIAYNAAGEQITSALEGETVTVRGATSILGQTFNGWILNPTNLQVTHDSVQQMHFVMPAEPVSIIGSYEDYMLSTVRLFFDDCIAGNEVDFTASNMSGSMMYPGYHCMTPEGHENVFYNGVAWWDDTDGRYLHPGDVYEANHVYQISAIIAADNGYVFDSCENLNVYTYPGGQCTVEELYISALDSTKHKFITSGDIIPQSSRTIDVVGGTAYNQQGDVITEAMPGDTVTLVADAPTFGWQFAEWSFMGEGTINVDDLYSATTTFVMPNEDIVVFSYYGEAPKVTVDKVSFSLLGYYINANAACLQVKASESVAFVDNNINDLPYVVFADNAGMPSGTQVTGALRNTAKHWIAVKVEPAFGYTLEGLTVDKISAPFAEKVLISADGDGTVNVFMLATYPPRVTGRSTVTVTNGNALVNNTVVTNAVAGMTVKIEAQEAPEGKFFAGWNVISGNVELEDSTEPVTSFTMGSTAVELEAVFKDYISYVEVQIPAPQAGMTPSYLASLDPAAPYMKDWNDNIYCRAGVIWYDVDTEENLDPKTAVFQNGHCYGVQILLRAKDGEQFLLDDYDYPAVTGCVNGQTDGVYVDQYTQDSAKQVMLTASFYLEEDAEIAEPVSQITLTELEPPVVGQPLCYTYSYDYMAFISCNSSYDGDHTLNGVTWTDITDPNNPIIMTPEVSVAEADRIYRVDLLMSPTNCKIFRLTADGWPDVEATINGGPCTVSAVPGIPATHLLQLSYYMYTCSHSDLSYSDNGDGTHTGVCSTCGEIVAENEKHSYGETSTVKETGACQTCGNEVFDINQVSMELQSSLSVKFRVPVSSLDLNNKTYYAKVVRYGADGSTDEKIIWNADWAAYNANYKFVTYSGVSAKQMNDKFVLAIFDAEGNQLSVNFATTIEQYVIGQLNTTDKEALKTVYVDLLNYGAYAQIAFKYDAENPANKNVTAEQQEAYATKSVEMEAFAVSGTGYYKTTLSLGNRIEMKLQFKNADLPKANVAYAIATWNNYKGVAKSQTIPAEDFIVLNANYYQVVVTDTGLADCLENVTVTLYDASGNVLSTVTDSVGNYVAGQSADANAIYFAVQKLAYSASTYFKG